MSKPLLAISLLSLFLTGCIHLPAKSNGPESKPLPLWLVAEFDYQKFQGRTTEKVLAEKSSYTIRQIQFASSHNILPDSHDILIDYYDLHGKKKTPVIMVLPIAGGPNIMARHFAKYFAAHGYAAVIVHRQEQAKNIQELDKLDLILRQMVFDHRQVVDWIETQPDIDRQKIGVFGISMGGIKAALIAPIEKRIKASVLALAGGNLADILIDSKEPDIKTAVALIMAKENLSREELRQKFRREITCDPINYAEYVGRKNTLIILALLDKVVPFKRGRELAQKINGPERVFLLSGHKKAIIYIWYVRRVALKFFKRKFEEL